MSNELPTTREWTAKDERHDRPILERPVSKHHQETYGHKTVDAVPGLWYRPGQRN